MKREQDYLVSSGRIGRVIAFAIAALCGSIGVPAALSSLESDAASELVCLPANGSSVFLDPQAASATPDHSLLSAADVERALPAPSRTSGLTPTTSS